MPLAFKNAQTYRLNEVRFSNDVRQVNEIKSLSDTDSIDETVKNVLPRAPISLHEFVNDTIFQYS